MADAVDRRKLPHALPRLLHQARVLERDRDTAGERCEKPLLVLAERVLPIDVLQGDHACSLAARHQRDEEHGLGALPGHDRASVSLGLGIEVLGDQQRLASLQDVLREAAQRLRLGPQPLAALYQVRVLDDARLLVDRRDRDDLRVEDVADPVPDRVVDRLRIELARDRVLHAVDQRQLRVSLPRLVHEPRVLERHAQTPGQGLQQLPVRLAECVLAVDVLQRDHARPPAPDDERHEEDRLRHLAGHDLAAVSLGLDGEILGEEQRLAGLEHVLLEAGHRYRLRLQPLTPFDDVRVAHEPRYLVERRNRDDLGVEDLPNSVAYRVVDRLRIELARDRVLHAVDQRQLRVSLPRLVHEPRVLERHAQTPGQGLQQLPVRLAECVLAVDVLQRDHARPPAPDDERHEEDRLRHLAGHDLAAVSLGLDGEILGEEQRLAGLEHVLLEAGHRYRLRLQPLTPFDDVRVAHEPRYLVERRNRDDLGVEDLPNSVAYRVVDRLRIELARDRVLHAVDQRQLRVSLPRLVHEPRVLERHAQTPGQGLQQLPVRLAECVLAVDVLQRDHARPPAPDDERHEEDRLRHLAGHDLAAVSLGLDGEILGEEQRLAGLEHVLLEAGHRYRLRLQPLTPFDDVRVAHEPRYLVERRNRDDLGVEDLPNSVAYRVVDRLRIELARDRVLHAVDQRQLRVSLPRLVHEARVLERHAQTPGQRLQQLLVGVGESVLAIDVLE